MKKVLTVFGTRPEAIKMALLVKALNKCNEIKSRLCVTAQHREMLDQVLNLFELEPDYDLNIMKTGQDLFDITSRVLLGMRDVLREFQPDIVLVHGDTTTSFAASLAAFYERIQIGHVEAGLRTYDLQSPWPEELNRQLTDRMADYYFSPTLQSRNNLLKEGISKEKILVTGNTVIDALLEVVNKINNNEKLKKTTHSKVKEFGYTVNADRKYIIVTGHRRENFGDGLQNICEALKAIASKNQDIDIVYIVHLNPNVQKPITDMLKGPSNIILIEPLDYGPFIYLMSKSHIILTDSGGIQEEASGLGKPVLVLRNTTERPEAVVAGTAKLVGTDIHLIINETNKLLKDTKPYQELSTSRDLYGDGKACDRIVNFLKNK